MGVEPAEFVSIGSAGLGLFAYLGLIRTLHVTNPKLLEGARGFIGVSAGAFACLCLALELHRNDDFTLIHNAAKRCTVLSNHKVCSFGLSAPNMGKNIACDLKQLANAMLRHGGFHEDVTMAGLQARLQAEVAFVATDLRSQQPLLLTARTFPDLSVSTAISMSAAVPLLTAPIHFADYLLTDGAVSEEINTTYFDPSKTLFVYSQTDVPAPISSEDLFTVMRHTLACAAKQQERLTLRALRHLKSIRINSKGIFNYVDTPTYKLYAEMDQLYVHGCARALTETTPVLSIVLARLAHRLANFVPH